MPGVDGDGDSVVHAGWLAAGWEAQCADDGQETVTRPALGSGPETDVPGDESGAEGGAEPGGGQEQGHVGDAGAADAIAAGIGARLERARTERGISQHGLARLVGVERPTVCRWERGVRMPSIPALLRAAAALAVPPSALLPDAAVDDAGGHDRGRRS